MMSKCKFMQKLWLFLKIQAWEREANFEWWIEHSLRYLIPFHFIKKKKNPELFCHLKLSDNIFQQLKLSSFKKFNDG